MHMAAGHGMVKYFGGKLGFDWGLGAGSGGWTFLVRVLNSA